MFKKASVVIIFIMLVGGCSSVPTEITKEDINETENEELIKEEQKEQFENEQEETEQSNIGAVESEQLETDQAENQSMSPEELEIITYFDEMLVAAEENNREVFLSFHDETNEIFYKEQDSWLVSYNRHKEQGWENSLTINNVSLDSVEKGTLELQISMKHDDNHVINRITYPIHKQFGEWKVTDLPFEKITNGPVNLYYLPTVKAHVPRVQEDLNNLIELYIETLGWELEELNVKLFDSYEVIAATVGFPRLSGVALPFVSTKFVMDGPYTDVQYNFMKHEIVHMMLADLTNDNAPAFMQEGLAILVAHSTSKNKGLPEINFENSEETVKVILENTPELPPIERLGDINYTNDGVLIYNVGFLITNYLIKTYGLEQYIELLKVLKEYGMLDYADPETSQTKFNNTIQAFEQIYGPIETLSQGYIEYYSD